MQRLNLRKRAPRTVVTALALTSTFIAQNAHAQAIPWESPLRQLLASLQGPTAQAIIIGAIVIAGLALCIGEAGSFFRRAPGIFPPKKFSQRPRVSNFLQHFTEQVMNLLSVSALIAMGITILWAIIHA